MSCEKKMGLILLNDKGEIVKTEHTEKCLTARAEERAELVAYTAKWPNFCRKCGAQGGQSDREYRGECHGVPAWEPTFNFCPHCVEQLTCPRCGVEGKNNFEDCETLKCFACGWTENSAGAPEVLNPYECGCFEDALEVAQEKERTLFRPLDGQY